MIVILARVDTTERVVTQIGNSSEISTLQGKLREALGGEWVWVQDLKQSQFIHFDCAEVYQGYDGREGYNYCGSAFFSL